MSEPRSESENPAISPPQPKKTMRPRRSRYWGPWVPPAQLWQDPIPDLDHELVDEADIKKLKEALLSSGISSSRLVATAWAAASSFRGTDKRGGAHGGRLRLAPQNQWEVHEPTELKKVLQAFEKIQTEFNRSQNKGKRISLADLIVLGGCAAVEEAARKGGYSITVPFSPGRMDALPEQTDESSFAVLEPKADGFRNYVKDDLHLSPETLLLDKANMLGLRRIKRFLDSRLLYLPSDSKSRKLIYKYSS